MLVWLISAYCCVAWVGAFVGEAAAKRTFRHAQVRPHDQHELALLIAVGGGIDERVLRHPVRAVLILLALLAGSARITATAPYAQAVAAVGLEAVGPVRGVVEGGVAGDLDVALVALDRVVQVPAALVRQLGRHQDPAPDRVHAQREARHEGRQRGPYHEGLRGGERVHFVVGTPGAFSFLSFFLSLFLWHYSPLFLCFVVYRWFAELVSFIVAVDLSLRTESWLVGAIA